MLRHQQPASIADLCMRPSKSVYLGKHGVKQCLLIHRAFWGLLQSTGREVLCCSAVCDDHHKGRSYCHRHCADDNIHHCNMRPRLCGKGVLSACPGAWVPYVLWSFMRCRTISTQQGWVNAATISIAIRCTALFDLSTSQYGFP